MKFIPNTPVKDAMLHEIGLTSIDDLFADIPPQLRTHGLTLPAGKSQQDVETHLRTLATHNKSFYDLPSFLGGGIKPHYLPAAVKAVISRSEFYTAYTPYQPEASQGFLQAIFEYQSMIADITGMDIANASLYDGATAVGEAALMAARITKKKTILIPANLSWEKKSILKNYTHGAGITTTEIAYDTHTGTLNLDALTKHLTNDIAAVYIENPNYFGIFEEHIHDITSHAHAKDALAIVSIDPLTLGIIQSPGQYGADIVIGEGKALGNPMDFGGSTLGILACRQDYIRQLPGRIIGMTKDHDGHTAYCMTFSTREQHIRREKATSNICTNEGLNMLATAVHLAWLGSTGLTELGTRNLQAGHDLKKAITTIKGYTAPFTGTTFNEFIIHHPNAKNINDSLLQKGIQGGLLLEPWFPDLKDTILFGVTELHTPDHIKRLLNALQEVA
jgi:glycine dehydrogenase subunit 1